MSSHVNRRSLLARALIAPALSSCAWPEYFELGWTEEILLHDGRIQLADLSYTYQRIGNRMTKYGDTILRHTTISFDAGPPIGLFSQKFEKHRIDMLENFQGEWYLLLETRGGAAYFEDRGVWREKWGSPENGYGQKCWRVANSGLTMASINDLPDQVLHTNVLMDYAETSELSIFSGTRITLAQKAEYAVKYPLDPNRRLIKRPTNR